MVGAGRRAGKDAGIDTERRHSALIQPGGNPGQGTYGFSVGWAAGPVGIPAQLTVGHHGRGLGWVDAFGDGPGERPRPGPQLAIVMPWPGDPEDPGAKCGRGELAWLEAGALPAEWCGPGAAWLAAGAVRSAGRAVTRVAGWRGPGLCGAGAATATWASC